MGMAVFLDRDGVIIENREDYVKHWNEVRFIADTLHALARLTANSIPIVILTNQSAIGRGLLSYEAANQIQQQINTEIEAHGGRIIATYICPHRPEEGCFCRKPAPGMLLRAAREHTLDLARSYLVGDAITDMQAALGVGVKPILVLTGRGAQQWAKLSQEERGRWPVVADLAAAVEHIHDDYALNRRDRQD